MCILCVASRWSRRIVAMLPWLVFPLTLIWGLSQLLPPRFQFEITSPRLACVAVLFMSLIWYEVVMPKLYTWRDRRRDVLRERRRIEAQEAAKRRKEATRKCRNCFTAYKDQTPVGGRFMCTFCGHVSKRPVLDVLGGASSAGSSFSLAGVATGFITGGGLFSSRSSKMWNVRGSQERPMGGRGWMGGRPWIDGGSLGVNGSWFGGSWPGSALYFGSAESGWAGLGNFAGGEVFGGERCSARESYFGVFWLVLRVISHLLFFVGGIWCKLCRVGFSGEDGMGRRRRSCHSAGEDAGPSPETRGEKARRKAEEKRIARLEKEQLEAEERKQREEVARLVEERRRQRDEKLEAEKESEREATAEKEREIKREREAEKRRQEKSREKVQSKERAKEQETEDLKKRKGKDIEKKADTDKGKGEDLKVSSVNTFESDKTSKGTKLDTVPKGNEGGPKVPSSSKWGSSKDIGSARTGFFSKSKNVAASATSFWGRSLSAGSKQSGQSSKAVLPGASSVPSTSNPGTASNGKPSKVSGSAWNRIHWANVWGKAGNKVPNDTPRKSEVVESTDKILESSGTDSVKCFVDGDVVSPSAVGVLQQPIAPPSSLPDLRDNLFSGPIGFPPVQLPVDSAFQELRQVQAGNRIHQVPYAPDTTSLLSTQSYYGSSSSVACAGAQVLRSCTCSDDTDLATPSSLPSSVSSSLNMIDFTGAEFDPLSASLMSSSVIDRGTSSSPLSSLNISSSTASTLLEDVEFRNAKQEQTLEPWNMPPRSFLSGTAARDSPTEGLWHHWSAPPQPWKIFSQPSLWDAPCQQGIDPLQPFHATLLEPNRKPESHLPSRTFSMEYKYGISGRPCGEHSCSLPMLGRNFWLDSPGVESIMHVWEDADMNQGVPPEFVDCITHSFMQDPVITADGHSYERSAIEAWLKLHDTSPKTGEVLPPPPGGNGVGVDKTLRPNHILRGQIIEYAEHVARGFGSHEMLVNPAQKMTAAGSAWSERNSIARPPMRGFYPSPGVKSFWSYNGSGG